MREGAQGRHTRFEAVRLRLEAFDPGAGWRLWLYEFLLFGFKQGWACLFGGLRLCPPGNLFEYALPWPARWLAVVCWPGTELNTRDARAVLPANLPRTTAVQHGAQFAFPTQTLHVASLPASEAAA